MKFGPKTISPRLFELARERMERATSTPDEVRSHLIKHGIAELMQTSAIVHNHKIIADRVFQAVRRQMVDAGELTSLKRGVWATTEFLAAAERKEEIVA
ncbi:hypothetical protein LMG26857_03266 [Achromobacter anxifer]|uniref:hypothetical protein n=1 Tax=Achromobacter anxifer TaxID=1287737 RepID=UPI00155BFEAE|nr:hypothetical protein [Achromobacter anxifer]CAB5514227.1 hypothetical protein LMG26857_03266 [Achromobacter anxifer]